MTLNYPRSIGDDYPEYLDDELGYHYHAWEVISASESTRFEAIRLGADAYLDSLQANLTALSDLELWALARRRLQRGERSSYFAIVTAITQGSLDHRAIAYPEVFADLSRRYAEDQELDSAGRYADKIGQHWPELLPAVPLLKAHNLLLAGAPEEAARAYKDAIEELAGDEAQPVVDLFFEAAEDFAKARAFEQARQFLDKAQGAAQAREDRASLVDIELLRRKLDEPSPHQS